MFNLLKGPYLSFARKCAQIEMFLFSRIPSKISAIIIMSQYNLFRTVDFGGLYLVQHCLES